MWSTSDGQLSSSQRLARPFNSGRKEEEWNKMVIMDDHESNFVSNLSYFDPS